MFTANVLCIQTSDVECCWCHLFKTAISYRRETMKLETNCFEIERIVVAAKKVYRKGSSEGTISHTGHNVKTPKMLYSRFNETFRNSKI